MPQKTTWSQDRHRRANAYVGRQLRLQRRKMRLSMKELARELGVTYQQVQKYEVGKNALRPTMLWQAAALLEVPIEYFFEGIEEAIASKATRPRTPSA